MAASTVRAAIIRSRLSFIGSRKGHALSGVGFLGALRMTTPANRLGGVRFRFLAPFRTESFIVGNKACTRSVGTFVSLHWHQSVPECSSPPMPQWLQRVAAARQQSIFLLRSPSRGYSELPITRTPCGH